MERQLTKELLARAAALRKSGLTWEVIGARMSRQAASIRISVLRAYPELKKDQTKEQSIDDSSQLRKGEG